MTKPRHKGKSSEWLQITEACPPGCCKDHSKEEPIFNGQKDNALKSKQARLKGKFCRVPDGYMSKEEQEAFRKLIHDVCYTSGHLDGYKEGKKEGYNSGFDKGHTEGYRAGFISCAFIVGSILLVAIFWG